MCPDGPSDSSVRCALSLSASNRRSEIFSRLNFSLLPSMATTVSATRRDLQEGMMRGVRKLPQLRLGPLQPLCRTSLPSLVLRLPRPFFVTLQVVLWFIPSFKTLTSLAKWPLDEIHQLAGPSGAGLGAIQHICVDSTIEHACKRDNSPPQHACSYPCPIWRRPFPVFPACTYRPYGFR